MEFLAGWDRSRLARGDPKRNGVNAIGGGSRTTLDARGWLSPAGTGPSWREHPPNAGGGFRQAVAFKFLNIVFFQIQVNEF